MKNQALHLNSNKMVELNTSELTEIGGGELILAFIAGVMVGALVGNLIWG